MLEYAIVILCYFASASSSSSSPSSPSLSASSASSAFASVCSTQDKSSSFLTQRHL